LGARGEPALATAINPTTPAARATHPQAGSPSQRAGSSRRTDGRRADGPVRDDSRDDGRRAMGLSPTRVLSRACSPKTHPDRERKRGKPRTAAKPLRPPAAPGLGFHPRGSYNEPVPPRRARPGTTRPGRSRGRTRERRRMDRLKVLCFAGTYGLALLFELARLVVRSPFRWYL